MAEFIYDETEIAKACMELPFGMPGGRTKSEAETKPGNCVKSNRCLPDGMPEHFGRLVQYGDECIVVDPPGRTLGRKPFVWKGTKTEYHRVWSVD